MPKLPTNPLVKFALGIGVIGSIALGGLIYLEKGNQDGISAEIAKNKLAVDAAENHQSSVASIGITQQGPRMRVLGEFGTKIESTVLDSGATLTQMQFQPNAVPLTIGSRRKKTPTGWEQNSLGFVVEGTTMQVFLALRAISQIDAPFRMNEVGFNRLVKPSGQSVLTANVSLTLLARKEGSV
ncbi:MAG: hypothetical protein J0L72_05005 [Armatimonadetes bacterium]|nr:hypothetical protein [Armatimonadota bacterium]